MKVLSQARRICGYQLRILRGNYKLYLIPVCLFVYMLNELIPIRDFLFSVNEKASPLVVDESRIEDCIRIFQAPDFSQELDWIAKEIENEKQMETSISKRVENPKNEKYNSKK